MKKAHIVRLFFYSYSWFTLDIFIGMKSDAAKLISTLPSSNFHYMEVANSKKTLSHSQSIVVRLTVLKDWINYQTWHKILIATVVSDYQGTHYLSYWKGAYVTFEVIFDKGTETAPMSFAEYYMWVQLNHQFEDQYGY